MKNNIKNVKINHFYLNNLMDSNKVYECPKCHNKLLHINKMLHDLKCTSENPAQYSLQNPTASYNYDYNDNNDYNNYSTDFNYYNSSQRNSTGSRLSTRMSIMNEDGTTTEIKKDTNMSGKEELLEITYDPQGNIIGRKKADGGSSNVKFKFRDMLEYKDSDIPENYYIYEGSNVYVETTPNIITYEIPVQNNYNYEMLSSNNFQHDFGNRGYSLMQSNISNAYFVNPDSINGNDVNNNSTNNNVNTYFDNSLRNNNYQSNNNNNLFNNYNNYQNGMNQFEQNEKNNNEGEPIIKFAKVTKLN